MKIKRRYLVGFLAVFLVAGLLWRQQKQNFYVSEIERPAAAEGEQKIALSIYADSKHPVRVELPVSPVRLSKTEVAKLLEDSWQQALEQVLGENESFLRVDKKLNFLPALPNGVQLEWYSSDTSLVNWEGEVSGNDIAGTPVTLMATLYFQGEELKRTQEAVVYPARLTKEAQSEKEMLEELLQAESAAAGEQVLQLPGILGDMQVRYHRETGEIKPVMVLLLGSIIVVLLALTEKSREKEAKEKRKKQLQMDYSELVTLFTIYLGAGLSIRNTWSLIVQEHAGSGRACYEEMAVTEHAMKAGCFEGQAYQDFGRRTQVTAYIRLGNLLAQNLKKGPKSLLGSLEAELNEAFEERKRIARRQGEEAGTKLMLPMFLLFGVILLYIMAPVMMSLSF